MPFKVRRLSRLHKRLGKAGTSLLEHGLNGLERLLPHVEVLDWQVREAPASTRATFSDERRRELRLQLGVRLIGTDWAIDARLRRLRAPAGVGARVSRTIADRERQLAGALLRTTQVVLEAALNADEASVEAVRATFDERVVAEHLRAYHSLEVNLGPWFAALRTLAEQTYENKALAFGCVVNARSRTEPTAGSMFPADFLAKKKYRALSDGYRTVYSVSARGAVIGFVRLPPGVAGPRRYFPEWCSEIACFSSNRTLGLCLTRQGDLLVFDEGQLAFTYRFGRWQYWNHSHIVDLLTNAARVQHVRPDLLGNVARSIYRAALDVSFRRTGVGLIRISGRVS